VRQDVRSCAKATTVHRNPRILPVPATTNACDLFACRNGPTAKLVEKLLAPPAPASHPDIRCGAAFGVVGPPSAV